MVYRFKEHSDRVSHLKTKGAVGACLIQGIPGLLIVVGHFLVFILLEVNLI